MGCSLGKTPRRAQTVPEETTEANGREQRKNAMQTEGGSHSTPAVQTMQELEGRVPEQKLEEKESKPDLSFEADTTSSKSKEKATDHENSVMIMASSSSRNIRARRKSSNQDEEADEEDQARKEQLAKEEGAGGVIDFENSPTSMDRVGPETSGHISDIVSPSSDVSAEGEGTLTKEETALSGLAFDMACCNHIGFGDPPLKKENQDVVRVEPNFAGIDNLHWACCLDGHGQYGKLVAEQVMEWMSNRAAQLLKKEGIPSDDAAWTTFLTGLFASCEQFLSMSAEIGFRSKMSGTTATLAFIRDARIHVANVGDSRGVLVTPLLQKMSSQRLSLDHRPEDPAERARIESRGGVVRPSLRGGSVAADGSGRVEPPPNAPLRVWLSESKQKSFGFPYPSPGLMLTRSLGDLIAKEAGCSPEPSCFHADIAPGSIYVAASDGLWDVLEDDDVCKLVAAKASGGAERLAQELTAAALEAWARDKSADNVGILVAIATSS